MSFQIKALDHRQFAAYFDMSDHELAARLAVRRTATAKPGYPCRVSLADAEIDDQLILVNYQHQPDASPYRAAHAISVRRGVEQVHPAIDEVPHLFRSRMLSLRAFDNQALIVAADLVDGNDLGQALDRMLLDRTIASIHIHYAKFRCYAACAERVAVSE